MAPVRTQNARKAARKPGRQTQKPLDKMVQCDICDEWFAGDLERHKRTHSKDTSYWCPLPECNRSRQPGHTGFRQFNNLKTHYESVHLQLEKPCQHRWICGGVIYECRSKLSDASALNRHRKNLHKWQPGDSAEQVAEPTPCNGDRCNMHTDDDAMHKHIMDLALRPAAGPSASKKQKKSKKTAVVKKEEEPEIDLLAALGSPSWEDIKPTQQGFGAQPLPPPRNASSGYVPAVAGPSTWCGNNDMLNFGALPPCDSPSFDDFLKTVLNVDSSVPWNPYDPAFFPTQYPGPVTYTPRELPQIPNHVLNNGQTTVTNPVRDAPAFTDRMAIPVVNPPYLPSPSRESTASPAYYGNDVNVPQDGFFRWQDYVV